MNEDEKRRIEEEEAYRAEVRAKIASQAPEKARRGGCGSGCATVGLVFLVIIAVGYACGEIMDASSRRGPSSSASVAPSPSFDALVADPSGSTATISFTSDPVGAVVTIGGRARGSTPVSVEVPTNRPWPYSLRVPADVPNHHLYHPFSATLEVEEDQAISVWIERLTSEEVAEQTRQREAAEQREREIQEQRQRELEARYLYYRVETNCNRGVNITMTNNRGDTAQYSNRSSAWYYAFVPRSGDFLYLSAQNQCDSGYVTVRFVQNEVVVRENTSRGGFVIATISGRW